MKWTDDETSFIGELAPFRVAQAALDPLGCASIDADGRNARGDRAAMRSSIAQTCDWLTIDACNFRTGNNSVHVAAAGANCIIANNRNRDTVNANEGLAR